MLTTLAVVVSVGFTVGVLVTTSGLRSTFDTLSEDIFEGVDLSVRPELAFGDRGESGTLVDPELLDDVRSVDGVAAAVGTVVEFNVVPITADGEAVELFGPPQIGIGWPSDDSLGALEVWPDGVSRIPSGPDEFAMDADTAYENGFEIGERYRVSTPGGTEAFTLVGLFRYGSGDNATAGAQMMAWDIETARQLLHNGGGYDSIDIRLEPNTSPEAASAAVATVLDDGLEVVANQELVEEQSDLFNEFIGFFEYFMLGFAVVILVVSAFIIYNTFTILVSQRTRELGLLRALGASGRQVTAIVVGEAIAVGVMASAAGLGLGVLISLGIRALISGFGAGLPDAPIVVGTNSILAAVLVGVGVTAVSAIWPALRARRVTPMAALTGNMPPRLTEERRSTGLEKLLTAASVILVAFGIVSETASVIVVTALVGAVLAFVGGRNLPQPVGQARVLILGLAMLIVAVVGDFPTSSLLALLGMSALLVFVGMNLVSPVFAVPVSRVLGWIPAKVSQVSGRLARQNAERSPRRTANTASALMISLALVSMVSVLGQSFKQTLDDTLDRSVKSDWLICPGGCGDPTETFSTQAAQRISERDEVASVLASRFKFEGVRSVIDGDVDEVGAVDLDVLPLHFDIEVTRGSLTDAGPGDVALHTDQADDLSVGVGDPVELEFSDGQTATFEVAAIFDNNAIFGSWLIDLADWDRYLVEQEDGFISALTAPGYTADQAREAIEQATLAYPQLNVRDQAEFQETQESQIDTFLGVVNAFLAISLIVALMGVANTLALSVFERTRELGLLRAVGMSRRQARRMIRWEGGIVAVFGGLMGITVGVLFGWATVEIIPDNFVSSFAIPWGTLWIYLVVVAVAGLLAASIPARRASRLNVLDAISYE
ncbi:MAG: FtsX-like permease family protein [Acidimicrobiia bacterium]|nr:FtsX-like permease family protein [Acidimicrobiia bacterium]MYE72946.1 FtsX-like permease family protein [Acidimicrobiia bacterium]MYJ63395.1 FtsX-like permease family protein [Acidimicrobiia bacterium]